MYDFFPHSNDNGTKAIPPTNASESENNDSDNHWQLHACRLPQEKLCCGRLHRSLLRLYRPQSAVSCSTLWERAAWSSPNTSQVSLGSMTRAKKFHFFKHWGMVLFWNLGQLSAKGTFCTDCFLKCPAGPCKTHFFKGFFSSLKIFAFIFSVLWVALSILWAPFEKRRCLLEVFEACFFWRACRAPFQTIYAKNALAGHWANMKKGTLLHFWF